MHFYKIAETTLAVRTESQYIIGRLEPFLTDDTDAPDLEVTTSFQKEIELPEGEIVSNEYGMMWIRKSSPDNGSFACTTSPTGNPYVAVDSNMDWTNCEVYYRVNSGKGVLMDNGVYQRDFLTLHYMGVAYRNHIVLRNGIVLHASCIEYQGKGIAFTAPSGTGKSTHTGLWERHVEGTRIINDDAPVIRIKDDKPYAYGSPWSGSTDKFLNMKVPLSAIVLLEQAKENSIRSLSIPEAVSMVMPRFLMPYHDRKMMELSVSTFERIISTVPVYSLKCRPDAEAVELVHQCIL